MAFFSPPNPTSSKGVKALKVYPDFAFVSEDIYSDTFCPRTY